MNIKELIEKMIYKIGGVKGKDLICAESIVAEGIEEIMNRLDNIKSNNNQLEFNWEK